MDKSHLVRCAYCIAHVADVCVRAQVAEVAAWGLFMWLFALSAYDALSGAPKLAWGTPLVVAGVYLILFTLHQGYQDVKELQKDMNKIRKPFESECENKTQWNNQESHSL